MELEALEQQPLHERENGNIEASIEMKDPSNPEPPKRPNDDVENQPVKRRRKQQLKCIEEFDQNGRKVRSDELVVEIRNERIELPKPILVEKPKKPRRNTRKKKLEKIEQPEEVKVEIVNNPPEMPEEEKVEEEVKSESQLKDFDNTGEYIEQKCSDLEMFMDNIEVKCNHRGQILVQVMEIIEQMRKVTSDLKEFASNRFKNDSSN